MVRVLDAIHSLHIEEHEVPDNTKKIIPVKNGVQAWAARNAYTLIFLSLMFIITWLLYILTSTGVI